MPPNNNQQLAKTSTSESAPLKAIVSDRIEGLYGSMPITNDAEKKRLGNTLIAICTDEKIKKCNHRSVLQAIHHCAVIGLVPNTPTGHCYVVPYEGNATFVLGYQGLVELARLAKFFEDIVAEIVFEGDKFTWQGHYKEPKHSPYFLEGNEKGNARCIYVAWRSGSKITAHLVSMDQVEKRRSMAMAKFRNKDNPSLPWNQWYEEMAKKTALKIAAQFWPKSDRIAMAIDADNREELGELTTTDTEVTQISDSGQVKADRTFGFGDVPGPAEPAEKTEASEEEPKAGASGDQQVIETTATDTTPEPGSVEELDAALEKSQPNPKPSRAQEASAQISDNPEEDLELMF